MIHKFDIKKSPRAMALSGVIIIIGAGGLIFLWQAQFPLNVILAGIFGLLTYYFSKIMRTQLQSKIVCHDDGLTAYTALGEKIAIPWDEVSHTGIVKINQKPVIFVYAESDDQLITIPNQYMDFDLLAEDIRRYHPIQSIELLPDQDIVSYIKTLLLDQES